MDQEDLLPDDADSESEGEGGDDGSDDDNGVELFPRNARRDLRKSDEVLRAEHRRMQDYLGFWANFGSSASREVSGPDAVGGGSRASNDPPPPGPSSSGGGFGVRIQGDDLLRELSDSDPEEEEEAEGENDAESSETESDSGGTTTGSAAARRSRQRPGGGDVEMEEELAETDEEAEADDDDDAILGLGEGHVRGKSNSAKVWRVVVRSLVEGELTPLSDAVFCTNAGKHFEIRCNDSHLRQNGGHFEARATLEGGRKLCKKCAGLL